LNDEWPVARGGACTEFLPHGLLHECQQCVTISGGDFDNGEVIFWKAADHFQPTLPFSVKTEKKTWHVKFA